MLRNESLFTSGIQGCVPQEVALQEPAHGTDIRKGRRKEVQDACPCKDQRVTLSPVGRNLKTYARSVELDHAAAASL